MSIEKNPYVPCTPAGTPLVNLASKSEEEAWKKLEIDTRAIYSDRKALVERGYTVERLVPL